MYGKRPHLQHSRLHASFLSMDVAGVVKPCFRLVCTSRPPYRRSLLIFSRGGVLCVFYGGDSDHRFVDGPRYASAW